MSHPRLDLTYIEERVMHYYLSLSHLLPLSRGEYRFPKIP